MFTQALSRAPRPGAIFAADLFGVFFVEAVIFFMRAHYPM